MDSEYNDIAVRNTCNLESVSLCRRSSNGGGADPLGGVVGAGKTDRRVMQTEKSRQGTGECLGMQEVQISVCRGVRGAKRGPRGTGDGDCTNKT